MSPEDRRHTDVKGDNRTAYQRDRDRVIYSGLYRRLAGVTQVVSALEGHVFHNRLTHTFKVAQVARRLAERLQRNHGLGSDVLDADVAEAAAHAHDLGHPPFGHIGEVRLQKLMFEHCGKDHFEGNAQSFRAVTKLARNGRGHPGLDLTRRTLDAILKYPWQVQDSALKKWGAYHTEDEDFAFARAGKRDSETQSLEAQVMDWADDIAYAVHDTEDLVRAGLVLPDRLRLDENYRDDFAEWVHARWTKHNKQHEGRIVSKNEIETALSEVTALLGFSHPYSGSADDDARLRMYSSSLISRYLVESSTLQEQSDQSWSLRIKPQARLEVDVLKELTWRHLIEGPSLAAQQHGQMQVIETVFCVLFDAASSSDPTSVNILPVRASEALQNARDLGDESEATRARVVADAICAMTEDEILRFHARLTGASLGSVLDAIV